MKSLTTERFRKCYKDLPLSVKLKAKKSYILWKKLPYQGSLQFKQIHSSKPIFSIRISLSYRALGVKHDNRIIWFWIGSHEDYNKMIENL